MFGDGDNDTRSFEARPDTAAGGENAAHDAELYVLLLANYAALVYRAAGRRRDQSATLHPDLLALSEVRDERFTRLRRFRNFHGHPPFASLEDDEVGWHLFADGPWVLLSGGRAVPIVDVEYDHGLVEDVHREVIAVLTEAIGDEDST